MGIVVPPALIQGLIEGGASAAAGLAAPSLLSNLAATLGLAKPVATATPAVNTGLAPAVTTPSATALSFPQSSWTKLSTDTQAVLLAANPQGIHLTAG